MENLLEMLINKDFKFDSFLHFIGVKCKNLKKIVVITTYEKLLYEAINENVGKYILKDNDEIIMNEDTNSFTIHYSKNGVHITPARKRNDKE